MVKAGGYTYSGSVVRRDFMWLFCKCGMTKNLLSRMEGGYHCIYL